MKDMPFKIPIEALYKKEREENGKLLSYIEELKYEINNLKDKPIKGTKSFKEKEFELLIKRNLEIKKLKEINRKLVLENYKLKQQDDIR